MNIRSLLHRSVRTMLNWRRWSKDIEVPTKETNKLRTAKELRPNDSPEFAYNRHYVYPKEYKPYTINNRSDMPLFFSLLTIMYGIYRYNKLHAMRQGIEDRGQTPQYKQ